VKLSKDAPVMDLVAGPQGSGKSTFFSVTSSGYDAFNIDEHRKRLNNGLSRPIPPDIQERAIADYEAFIEGHIDTRTSFAIEVTLAREITFEQAKRARSAGFLLRLTFVAAELNDCIERVASRLEAGGHGVPEAKIKETYAASMKNLSRAVREFDVVQVYDNSRTVRREGEPKDDKPQLVLETQRGTITHLASSLPRWLTEALRDIHHLLG